MRATRKSSATKGAKVVIADFSGNNWDDDAMNLLMDSLRFESLMNVQLHAYPIRTVRSTALAENSGADDSIENFTEESPAEAAVPDAMPPLLTENLHTTSDLSHSDLAGADLSRADLRGANLTRSNLYRARLDHANLEKADLRGADLRSARLAAAKLRDTRLYGALFDRWTDLPFSKDDAIRRGMIYLEVEHQQ